MKHTNSISVPSPCSANWDTMTPQGKGKHCGSCNKIVVDFTNMSNQEILNFLKEKKYSATCGHFHNYQLNQQKKNKAQEFLIKLQENYNNSVHPKVSRPFVLFFLGIALFIVGCNPFSTTTTGEIALPDSLMKPIFKDSASIDSVQLKDKDVKIKKTDTK